MEQKTTANQLSKHWFVVLSLLALAISLSPILLLLPRPSLLSPLPSQSAVPPSQQRQHVFSLPTPPVTSPELDRKERPSVSLFTIPKERPQEERPQEGVQEKRRPVVSTKLRARVPYPMAPSRATQTVDVEVQQAGTELYHLPEQ